MKKRIRFSTKGTRADIGAYVLYRILPNMYETAVGPFVFLDYSPAIVHEENAPIKRTGNGAHPHRGIATLTYIISGQGEHDDSAGHHGEISSGGVQWMKAGQGVMHDESLNPDPINHMTHALQFWINLPPKNKTEPPQYEAIQANQVPRYLIGKENEWLKVIAGTYKNLKSKIPNYSEQFLYHLHLEKGGEFSILMNKEFESAALVVSGNADVNGEKFEVSHFLEFEKDNGSIEIKNTSEEPLDIILFGGKKYHDPIVSEGPFVMNSKSEIIQAYDDFHTGKYGKITYKQ